MTLDDAIDLYIDSSWFVGLASNTQTNYLAYLDKAKKLLPTTTEKVTPLLADKIYAKVKSKSGERTAIYFCSVMRRLWNFLYRAGEVQSVPWAAMGVKNTLKPRDSIWSPEQVDKVIDEGSLGLSLFVSMSYDTGQRPSDILSVTKSNVKDGCLSLEQSKTGTKVVVPLTSRTLNLLDRRYQELPNTDTLVCTKTGLKYHLTNLNNEFRIVRDKLGIPSNIQLRDLRRTTLTELGNAGATEDEIIAVSGHKSRQVVSVYVQKTKQQAFNAMEKRKNNQ